MADRYCKHVYCEKKFLEHCIKTIAEWKFCENNYEELQLWMCIKKMIFSSDIVLHLNITFDEIDTIENKSKNELTLFEKNLCDILDRQQQNTDDTPEIQLVLRDFVTVDNIDKSNNTHLTAYYLTCCDSETCQNCMEECGVLAICPENLKNYKAILYDNGVAIKRNETAAWKKIINCSPCLCNSLILVDNYIFNDFKLLDDNLKQILDAMLPEKLSFDIPFHISICSEMGNKTGQDCLMRVENLIKNIRPNLIVKIDILKCSTNEFHDRIIITNNIYLSCGSGFEIFKYDFKISKFSTISTKTTSVNILFPFFQTFVQWTTNAYSNIINEVSRVLKSRNAKMENRLIS